MFIMFYMFFFSKRLDFVFDFFHFPIFQLIFVIFAFFQFFPFFHFSWFLIFSNFFHFAHVFDVRALDQLNTTVRSIPRRQVCLPQNGPRNVNICHRGSPK